jgi:probable F420-dependent oxidoreductase
MGNRGSGELKVGVWLSSVRPDLFVEVAQTAERLGFESLWISEHLILPNTAAKPPGAVDTSHPMISSKTPTFDALAYLSYLAALTSQIRLGTWIYLIGLRHPFVTARAVQTLDIVSNGRAEFGIGAGWLASEWEATQLEFRTRGNRLSEAVDICRRLWSEASVEHHGEFFDFGSVGFEPKPRQDPSPRIHLGGESLVALRRAALIGDGWIGMQHTPVSAASIVSQLGMLRTSSPLQARPLEITVGGSVENDEDREAWETSGVTRVIVAPWKRSSEAIESLHRVADGLGLKARDRAHADAKGL